MSKKLEKLYNEQRNEACLASGEYEIVNGVARSLYAPVAQTEIDREIQRLREDNPHWNYDNGDHPVDRYLDSLDPEEASKWLKKQLQQHQA